MFFERSQARTVYIGALVCVAALAPEPAQASVPPKPYAFARDAESRQAGPELHQGLDERAPRIAWSSASDPQALVFAKDALSELWKAWELPLDEEATRTLRFEVGTLLVDERPESVGATYGASCTLGLALLADNERVLWKGRARGTSSRFGRAGYHAIAELALSDAFTEALAALLGQDALQQVWLSAASAAPSHPPQAPPKAPAVEKPAKEEAQGDLDRITPAALRDDLLALMGAGFDEQNLLDVVASKALTRSFTEKDAASWRAAGIPESVLRAARARPLR